LIHDKHSRGDHHPEAGVLSEDQNREIADLAAQADKHIVEVYRGKVEMI